MNRKLIAISGKQRSGKSSVCDVLMEEAKRIGFKPHRVSHTSWMSMLCSKGLGKADRETLQKFGTEVVQDGTTKFFNCPEFWTNLILSDLPDLFDNGYDFILCDDVRFKFQADRLRSDGFIIVRLITTVEQQLERKSDKPFLPDHRSEIAMDNLEGTGYFDMEMSSFLTVKEIAERIFADVILK